MVWLREKEKLLRAQSKAITVHEVERELDAMKVPRESVIVLFVVSHLGVSKNYITHSLRSVLYKQ